MEHSGDRGGPGRPAGERGIRRAPAAGDVVQSRRVQREDDDEFDEGPQQADIERFSHVTRNCPACKKDVFDDSAVCYHCGHAFEKTTAGSTKTPLWVIVTVMAVVVAMIFAVLSGFRFF